MTDSAIERYAAKHTTPPPPHLAEVAAVTRERTASPQMRSGLVEARLLEALVVAGRATRVLEVGTFTGYGALSIAARLPAGGTVITIEYDPELAELARAHIESSPDAAKIDLRVGDAREIVPALDGPFDLVFIDAWKPDYAHYYEAVLPKLSDAGLIVCDNVLWSGEVIEAHPESENTRALQAFNDRVQADARVHNALLTVGDGLLVVWPAR
ncbi:MAG TPA: class I SAM-dependent methyltransferase [Solirubrobacteraceae bacterium]|nr:class I SAM-dependent methyltransferase [Solirubrobacteraceae bacterium]